jgi:hypothetical protein
MGLGPVPTLRLTEPLFRFVESVETQALQLDLLRGAYAVTGGPVTDFRRKRRPIREGMLVYLRETSALECADPRVLLDDGESEPWTIQKLGATESWLALSSHGNSKWEGEAAEDLAEWLPAIPERKAAKLTRLAMPKVLLLIDSYHFAGIQAWRGAVLASPARFAFEAIARVTLGDRCVMLTGSGALAVESSAT